MEFESDFRPGWMKSVGMMLWRKGIRDAPGSIEATDASNLLKTEEDSKLSLERGEMAERSDRVRL